MEEKGNLDSTVHPDTDWLNEPGQVLYPLGMPLTPTTKTRGPKCFLSHSRISLNAEVPDL